MGSILLRVGTGPVDSSNAKVLESIPAKRDQTEGLGLILMRSLGPVSLRGWDLSS